MKRTLELYRQWWERIQYETPPWAWDQDPKLAGITESEFKLLRNMKQPPTESDIEEADPTS